MNVNTERRQLLRQFTIELSYGIRLQLLAALLTGSY